MEGTRSRNRRRNRRRQRSMKGGDPTMPNGSQPQQQSPSLLGSFSNMLGFGKPAPSNEQNGKTSNNSWFSGLFGNGASNQQNPSAPIVPSVNGVSPNGMTEPYNRAQFNGSPMNGSLPQRDQSAMVQGRIGGGSRRKRARDRSRRRSRR